MKLRIDDMLCDFVPIKAFRAAHDLPAAFGVAHFQPKAYAGLGSIDSPEAGAALRGLRADLLAAVPDALAPADLLPLAAVLTDRFRAALQNSNQAVGLRPEDVEFAVAGVADVVQAYAYGWVRARLTQTAPPEFAQVYADWLQGSVRISGDDAIYAEGGRAWRVRIVSHVYGRVGLIVRAGTATHYVYDPALACPAEGFMAALLAEVCGAVAARAGS